MTTAFKPHRMNPAPEGYVETDELHRIYGEAWNEGLWVKEFGAGPNGTFMAACGSVYLLQLIEHVNPDSGEIDVADLMLGDCIEISVPGKGNTREAACQDAISNFKSGDVGRHLLAQHQAWHSEVTA